MEPTSDDNPLAAEPTVERSCDGAQSHLASARLHRVDLRRWWTKLILQPIIFLAACVSLIVGLGAIQRLGWLSTGDGSGRIATTPSAGETVRYICPMMCTPPQSEPGRCPVCAMELVPATSTGGEGDGNSIQVDPVARRVANIRTVPVEAIPLVRQINAIGQLSFDEGTLRTIAAYVDGRLERLYADYTGIAVEAGDQLALLYSPQLYSSQVELLVARRSREQRRSANLPSASSSAGRDLYDSARERLTEFGMTATQIDQLEKSGEANSRLHLCAPMSGTVIEKLAVEGQYVKTGQPIYRLADLSTVWLMLQLFPEDASAIRYGQEVKAEVQSLPGREFAGRVAFVDPTVDPRTRTVGVRVVIRNGDGTLRVGDYAKATIAVQLSGSGQPLATIYDPELAGKWIGPRHPHVIESSPGKCRVCGAALVPVSQFGYTNSPTDNSKALVVPRDAVLMAGQHSVVYVETEAGRFEIRRVLVGPPNGNNVAILSGLQEGELVASSGNFLIDSQMQLAGKPSLIDPTRERLQREETGNTLDRYAAAFSSFSSEDRALILRQRICPVSRKPLGSMGTPPKVDVNGTPVFICCEGCRDVLLNEPARYLANIKTGPVAERARDPVSQPDLPPMEMPEKVELEAESEEAIPPQPDGEQQTAIAAALSRLTPADRALAEKQRVCPVTSMPLGSMGTPIKVIVNEAPVFICCEGCRDRLLADPARYLARLPKETVQ